MAESPPAVHRFAADVRGGLPRLDPETAARGYLDHALESDQLRAFTRPKVESAESEFKSLGAEAMPLTDTTVVKFRQTFHKVPVYGSLVTVELDANNDCVGINSSLGAPKGVDHVARVAPAAALAVAAKTSGQAPRTLTNTPRLHYYYDKAAGTWRLVYIIEDVPQRTRPARKNGRRDATLKDIVVDAHSGKLVAALPRTPTVAAQDTATDGLGASRSITIEILADGGKSLHDTALNLVTYDFAFKDPSRQSRRLPGRLYHNPPTPWPAEAVSAHANGAEVARFLRDVVKRNNIDDKGGRMRASVNCWDRDDGKRPKRQWVNAFWNGSQMVYGQTKYPDGSFFSIANMLDIVGHEMFHGVTDHSARLEYEVQSGALNESYSDIFGTIIANRGRPLDRWSWKLGVGFEEPGRPLRDMADPTRHGQPKRMRHFKPSTPPYTYERNDYGEVHDNSGIHNYAAYRVMTAKAGAQYVFTEHEIAAMFYVALTAHLSRTSQFRDSRRAVLQAARSLFRNDPAAERDAKLRAIEKGFSAAEIEESA